MEHGRFSVMSYLVFAEKLLAPQFYVVGGGSTVEPASLVQSRPQISAPAAASLQRQTPSFTHSLTLTHSSRNHRVIIRGLFTRTRSHIHMHVHARTHQQVRSRACGKSHGTTNMWISGETGEEEAAIPQRSAFLRLRPRRIGRCWRSRWSRDWM